MKTETIIRNEDGFKLERVKRNFQGSYAVTYRGVQSKTQFNEGTVSNLKKLTRDEFIRFAKLELGMEETPSNQAKPAQVELEAIEITPEMREAGGYRQSDALVIRHKGIDHMNLATIHPWGNPNQFAQRIVKAMNMHDELVRLLSEARKYFPMNSMNSDTYNADQHLLTTQIQEMLKQEEQK